MGIEDIKKGEMISFNGGVWRIEDVGFGASGRLMLMCSPQSSSCNWGDDELKSIPATKAELS